MTGSAQVLSAVELDQARMVFRHPLDATAGCVMTPISRVAGAIRSAVNHVRIAPGEQAFPLHRHHGEEEWVYVLEGTGEVLLDDQVHPVDAGAFAVFPAAGPAHGVRNTGEADMICLMGSDLPATDVIDVPGVGKRVVRAADGYHVADTDAFQPVYPTHPIEGDDA